MLHVFLTTLQLEADHLALWLDEALHNPLISKDEFTSKITRYGTVLHQIKCLRDAHVAAPGVA